MRKSALVRGAGESIRFPPSGIATASDLAAFLDATFDRVFADRPADFDPWFFHYFDEQTTARGRRRYARALIADLALAGVDVRGRTVVDAGSGFGVQLLCFAALGGSPAVGLEAFGPMAATARRLAARAAPALPVQVMRASVSRMPLPGGSVDFIYCNEALSHFIDPPGFLRECARVLRRGGRLMVCDGNNAANRWTVRRVHAIWRAFEEGPTSENVFGHRVDHTYRDRRRRMLEQTFGEIDDSVLERLAWGTFGLSGDAVVAAAREMLASGPIPESPPAVDRCPVDPVKGDHVENLIDASALRNELRALGFQVRVRAHFGGARGDWLAAANRVLRAATPLTLRFARSVKVVATRR